MAVRSALGVGAAAGVFVGVLWLSTRAELVHPFLALTATAGVIGAVVASAPRLESRP